MQNHGLHKKYHKKERKCAKPTPRVRQNSKTRTTKENNHDRTINSSDDLSKHPVNFESDPESLTPDLRPVPILEPQMLPASLREWVVDISERQNSPLEYAAATCIVALSALIGRKVGVRPKQYDSWTVVPNLWGMAIGSPGQRKTPAVSGALTPLQRLVADAIETHKDNLQTFEAEKLLFGAQASAAKKALGDAAKKSEANVEELMNLAQQAVALETQPPVLKRYIVNDATVEALGERLLENPTGLLLFRDELLGFLRTFDKQGHESDRAFYNQAWNGTDENFTYDRIMRGTIIIPSPTVSVFGTIQPGPLTSLLRGAAAGVDADGFISRFQLMVYPDALPYQHIDRRPDNAAKNSAYAIFKALDDCDTISLNAKKEIGCSIPFFHFSPEAQIFFNDWMYQLETAKLTNARSTPLIESHIAKYRSLMPSLALIFHLVDAASGTPATAISLQNAQQAVAWCDFLEEHAHRIYQLVYDGSMEPALSLAMRIEKGELQRLRHYDGKRFKVGDIVQNGWAGLTTTEDVNRAIAVLESRHWLQRVESPPKPNGGRPEQWIYLNPLLTESNSGQANAT